MGATRGELDIACTVEPLRGDIDRGTFMFRFITTVLVAASLASGVHAAASASVRPILIGIHAIDYDITVAWYSRNFGFEVEREVVNENGNIRIGFLDNGSFELEIYAEITRDTTRERLRRDRFGMPAEGFVKLSLLTDDLVGLQRSLAANGVEFVREINESDRKPGYSWFMVSDPDSNLVQVFGHTPAVDPV